MITLKITFPAHVRAGPSANIAMMVELDQKIIEGLELTFSILGIIRYDPFYYK